MHESPSSTTFGSDALAAAVWASELHADQMRRGGSVPYVSHLLAVAALVMEDGGTEFDVIVALLHDAVEDQGGAPLLDEIARRHGADVAACVAECTDSVAEPKPSWADRKRSHLQHLREQPVSTSALRVAAADKLHNARSIVADLRRHGPDAWAKFSAEPAELLEYYRGMAELLADRLPDSRNGAELVLVVAELAQFWAPAPEDLLTLDS